MKNCRFCNEKILDDAIKCRFCGEWVDGDFNIETAGVSAHDFFHALVNFFKRKFATLKKTKLQIKYSIYLVLIFFSFSFFIAYIAIYKLDGLWINGHDYLNFLALQLLYFKKIKWYSLLIFVALLIVVHYFFVKNSLLHTLLIKKYLAYFLGSLIILFLAFNFAFVGSYGFAVFQLKKLEYKISTNPIDNHLIWDDDIISKKLDEELVKPEIFLAEDNLNNQIAVHIINAEKNKSEFYKKIVIKRVLKMLPVDFLIPQKSSMVMFDDNIYIKNFNGDSFEKISASLGKVLVKNQIGPRNNKEIPSIQVLEKEKYGEFRIQQINAKIKKLEEVIDVFNSIINEQKQKMNYADGKVQYYKNLARSSYAEGDSAFLRCSMAESCSYSLVPNYCSPYSFFCSPYSSRRTCVPTFSYFYCDSLRQGYYNNGDDYIRESNDWVRIYNNYVAVYNEYIGLKEKATNFKYAAEASKESIPYELGIFEPDNKIKIAIESSDANNTSRYLSTLIHEYLHYDSYVSNEKSLPQFFEEGLTEHFSRKIQKESFESDINLGYPLVATMIKKIIEKVPEDDLLEIYYSKDVEDLRSLINKNLGENFYEENIDYLNIIFYIPEKLALTLGNNILEKMSLEKIEEVELYKMSSQIEYN